MRGPCAQGESGQCAAAEAEHWEAHGPAQPGTATRWAHAAAVLDDVAGRVLAVVERPALWLVGVGMGWCAAIVYPALRAWWVR